MIYGPIRPRRTNNLSQWILTTYVSIDRVVFHEWTHLWWIGPTNEIYDPSKARLDEYEDETYGYTRCALKARNDNRVKFNRDAVVWNADNYAWYAQYGYWAEEGFDSWKQQNRPVQVPIRLSD